MKRKIIEALVNHEEQHLKSLNEEIGNLKTYSDLDEDDTIDPEDLSHQAETTDVLLTLKEKRETQKLQISKARSFIDTKATNVHEGSLVRTEELTLLIGASLSPIDFEGHHCLGISIEAPVYEKMRLLEINDEFEYNGKSHKILSIL